MKGFTDTSLFVLVIVAALMMFQQAANAQQTLTTLNSTTPLATDIFREVNNSVVQITSTTNSPETQNITQLGSGFVYDMAGHIITNTHVVGGAKTVGVSFVDGNRYIAKVIGTDPYSDTAVLQLIMENLTQTFRPLPIGNSSKIQVGQQVVAIGHPFGIQNTLTAGVISQSRYLLTIPDIGVLMPNSILSDTAINPGNSGGPLLNLQGQVVGINIGRVVSIASSSGPYPGLTAAGPSNSMVHIIKTLIKLGSYLHPYLGLAGSTLTSDLAQTVQGLAKNFKGVFVNSIEKNGPADKAGIEGSITNKYSQIQGADVITAVDGHRVVQMEQLMSYIEEHKSVGDSIVVTVNRHGQTLDFNTTLAARPPPSPLGFFQKPPSQSSSL
jgi:S1-C subfamily serine protease